MDTEPQDHVAAFHEWMTTRLARSPSTMTSRAAITADYESWTAKRGLRPVLMRDVYRALSLHMNTSAGFVSGTRYVKGVRLATGEGNREFRPRLP